MADENATLIITDIKAALEAAEKEAGEKPAALLMVGGDLNGTIYDLHPGDTTIGRNPENKIQIEVEGISRSHFKVTISPDGSEATLEDTGSRNGTFLNDQKIEKAETLKQTDIIKIGSLSFKYLPKGDPERLTYDKLSLEANTDGHTGCFNKTYFNNAIEKEVKNCKTTGKPLSLMVFDLDKFKNLNDNFGHDAGDYVLRVMAEIIREDLTDRPGDLFARYGGEEFVVLMPDTNLKIGFAQAEKLRKLVEEYKFIYEEKELPVTASIGVSDYRSGVNTGTDMFKRADEAVYKSKEGGRNQVNFYKPA